MRPLATLVVLAERTRIKGTISLLLLSGITALAAGPTLVAAAEDSVIQISAVLASKDHREFDPRLAPLKAELRGLPFKSYTLLNMQSCRLQSGDHCAMDIPGGGYLHLTTTQTSDRHLKMRVLLNQENRPILNADIKLDRDAGILLKSVRTGVGVIILSIKTQSPPSATAASVAE